MSCQSPRHRAVALLLVVALLAPTASRPVEAQAATPPVGPRGALYVGTGEQAALDELPLVLGGLFYLQRAPVVLGFDFAAEGAKEDGTYGYQTTEQALSFNLLAGLGVRLGKHGHLGVSGLIGARQESADCPRSYLGYQCYADEAPTVTYTPNAGAIVHASYRRVMLGARYTDASRQAVLGIAF